MRILFVLFSVSLSQWVFASVPQKLSQFEEGDRLIYSRLIEAYRKGNLVEVINQRKKLAKLYKSSVYLDRAYYLNGVLELQNNRLGEALKNLDIVTDKFVLSHKRPAAFFAMAMTYKKMNLPSQAHAVLRKIMKEYPASPEARRAWAQLRLEKQI